MATIAKTIPHVEETNTRHLAQLYESKWWFGRAVLAYASLVDRHKLAAVREEIIAGIGRGLSDSGITNAILARYWNKEKRSKNTRGSYRAIEIAPLIRHAVNAYVDFGCGDRTITEAVGKYYGLVRENIIGVDIFDSGSPGSIFVNTTREIAGGSINLITAFVSLHHVADQEEQIAEFARILRPGGTVVIREHDLSDDKYMFNYLQHIHIVAAVWDTEGSLPEILRTTTYRPQYVWTTMFMRAGFKFNEIKRTDPEIPNPQGLYYCAFVKENYEV